MFGLWIIACVGSEPDSGTSATDSAVGESTPLTDTAPTVDSGAHTGDSGGSSTTLTQHGVVTCAEPELRDSEGPMVLLDHGQAWDDQVPSPGESFNFGTTLAVEDFDGDGHWDIFLGHVSAGLWFRGTEAGELVLDTQPLPALTLPEDNPNWRARGITAADVDADGDPDLVIGTAAVGTLVWRNDAGVFVDASELSGLSAALLDADGLPMGDLDGDGDLDLFLGHDSVGEQPPDPGQDNALYLNQGDGTFVDVSDRLEAEHKDGYVQVATLADLDLDGDVDLYITNHHGSYSGSKLLLNDGTGTWTAAPDAGLDVNIEGMGVALGDTNDDGLPDLLISGWGELALLESVGAGVWARTEKVRELVPDRDRDQEVAWGNALADLDNDGDLDAVVGFSKSNRDDSARTDPEDQPDGLWLREGDVFVDQASSWGLRQKRDTRAVVVWDYNGDGWLDVLKSAVGGKAVLWTARCGDAAWLEVSLAQPVPNPRAIGAQVRVEAGDRSWVRWVTAGSIGYVSSAPPQVHFGLGDVDAVDRVVVTWPDGTEETLEGVDARQRVTVTRGGP